MANDYWQTPPYILNAVKQCLGDDYFDPCPINPAFDGLSINWGNNCFINPPYSVGSLQKWSEKAKAEYSEGGEYIWLINYDNTTNRTLINQNSTAICIPSKRIQFIDPSTGKPSTGNRYCNIIYYWGLRREVFSQCFKHVGEIFLKW